MLRSWVGSEMCVRVRLREATRGFECAFYWLVHADITRHVYLFVNSSCNKSVHVLFKLAQ